MPPWEGPACQVHFSRRDDPRTLVLRVSAKAYDPDRRKGGT
ncbi:hypothetical protein THTE_3031 [Thermogutta terrifontis]|uniref:Uncharacterized protein n=1 Tax=Thermogutta terrifontis TaxID=1331910 RepID=A0A286RI35_9BACT|nr:hypothetical protein THTE_3031 [Thermogutta terrifontis]